MSVRKTTKQIKGLHARKLHKPLLPRSRPLWMRLRIRILRLRTTRCRPWTIWWRLLTQKWLKMGKMTRVRVVLPGKFSPLNLSTMPNFILLTSKKSMKVKQIVRNRNKMCKSRVLLHHSSRLQARRLIASQCNPLWANNRFKRIKTRGVRTPTIQAWCR